MYIKSIVQQLYKSVVHIRESNNDRVYSSVAS